MDYNRHYSRLVENARNRTLIGYGERHHILPRCIGGRDTGENIVRLTPEEHFVAHQLLVKMYPDHQGLKYALYLMTRKTKKMGRKNKAYGWIRRKLSEANRAAAQARMSDPVQRKKASDTTRKWWDNLSVERKADLGKQRSHRQKGSRNSFFGRNHSEETRKKLSKYRQTLYRNMTDEDYRNHPQTVSVSIEGVLYHSLSLAARHHGIGPSLVRYRCLSETKKWKDWYYLD